MTISWEINPTILMAVLVNIIVSVIFIVRASDRATAAEKRCTELAVSLAAVDRELQEFKLEAARRFVTDEMLAKVEESVIGAINRLADRLDRVIESRRPRGQAPL